MYSWKVYSKHSAFLLICYLHYIEFSLSVLLAQCLPNSTSILFISNQFQVFCILISYSLSTYHFSLVTHYPELSRKQTSGELTVRAQGCFFGFFLPNFQFNHRMVQVGRDMWRPSCPISPQEGQPQASAQAHIQADIEDTPKGDPTTPLSNLYLLPISPAAQKCFLVYICNTLFFSICSLLLDITPGIPEKSLAPPSAFTLQIFVYIDGVPPGPPLLQPEQAQPSHLLLKGHVLQSV